MNLKRLKCHSLGVLTILLLFAATFYSCKKTDNISLNDRRSYIERFFKEPAASSPELQVIIDLLKEENNKTGFVNTLPDNAGLPVWNKLIAQKTKTNYAARGIVADEAGNMLIPLSNDNKTLSALLFAMKHDKDYEFYCYDNNYAYGITFSDKYTIKQREMVIGLFMGMSNYVFGTNKFKSIPQELFEGYKSKPEENGTTKKIFLKLADGTLPDIFISGMVTAPFTKCYWEFTGICNCPGSNNTPENCHHPNSECISGICTKEQCYTLIFESGGGPSTEPPPGNPNNGTGTTVATSKLNWSNSNGGTLPGTPSTGSLPNAPCSNNCSWYTVAPAQNVEQYCGHDGMLVGNECVSPADFPGKEDGFPYKWWEDEIWLKEKFNFDMNNDISGAPSEKLTLDELDLIRRYPKEALKVNRNALIATNEAITRFPNDKGINDKSDAFRHTYWSALNIKSIGALAILFANAHESEVEPKFNMEKTMDLHNNAIALHLFDGPQTMPSNQQIAELVKNAVVNGQCRYMSPINYDDPCFYNCSGNPTGTHGITSETQLKSTNQ